MSKIVLAHLTNNKYNKHKGAFNKDTGTKKEFFDNIKLQQEFAPR